MTTYVCPDRDIECGNNPKNWCGKYSCSASPPIPAAVPPGYALVPIEPTPEMITRGAIALVKASDSDLDPTMEEIEAAYRAMITPGAKP